jgi:hypothetical protein
MTKARELSELAKAVTISDNRIDFDRELQLSNASITADVNFGDNDKVIFGAGNDLQIYHDAGGNSFINESGFGSLFMQGDNIRFRTTDGTGTYALFTNGGAVDLYHNNSLKLATTATGVTVTGTVTAGDITLSDNNPTIIFDDANGVDQNFTFAVNGGTANIQSRTDAGVNTTRFTVSSNGNIDFKGGDISFYEDTGTTPKLFWDASAERLGIGTSTPDSVLHVISQEIGNGSNKGIKLSNHNETKEYSIRTGVTGSENTTLSIYDETASADRLVVSTSGNIGIGDDAPDMTTVIAYSDSGTDFNANDFTGGLGIYNTNDSNNTSSAINFKGGSRHDVVRIGAVRTSNSTSTSSNSADFVVSTRHLAGSLGERFRITSNGSVGIGISNPSELIHANGSAVSALLLTTNSYTNGTELRVQGDGSSYLYNRENAMLRFGTNNLERMRIDANGHVTMPYQSVFSAKITSQQSNIATATQVTVLFATELYDQNSDYNNSTYTFTAPVTGKYQLNVLLLLNNVDTLASYYQTQLTTSNRTYYHTHDARGYSQDLAYHNIDVSVLADMDAGDTAIVKIYQATGTAQTDLDAESYFTGYLVC